LGQALSCSRMMLSVSLLWCLFLNWCVTFEAFDSNSYMIQSWKSSTYWIGWWVSPTAFFRSGGTDEGAPIYLSIFIGSVR
jgi:hypothetical protein